MATIPQPRSFNQTLGDMVDALLSKLGIPSLPAGDPILTILEAAAQSDVRSTQDIFQQISSIALDKATGIALARIGADEDLEKFQETPSSGLIVISDSSFTKTQSTIFQGLPAPIIGSSTINVVNALDWPASGSIYIGRGTNQYEGPLNYTSIVNNTSYWTINLQAGNFTQKFHNLGENVILAQGGDRIINAGTLVQTPQGNTGEAVQFSVLYSATIPDGETEITNVTVVARKPGVVGNIAAGAITSFSSAPFTGATVTNTTPFTNGRAAESDKEFRERIRNVRQSRSRGTALAIKTFAVGTTSTEENKRIISASVITRESFPTTLYIDDGSGYEEKTDGVAYEIIADSALGGEQYFSLANGRPVAKAFTVTQFTSPFVLSSGEKIAVKVGGTVYEHTFNVNEFRNINNASAYEVVASINGNANVKFSARTADNGTRVAIFADDDTNEDIEVTKPSNSDDANVALGFPVGKVDTLRLYKNDRLLNKDGNLASLTSKPQSSWSTMASGETLQIVIDGVNIGTDTYTITDADFVNAGTVYSSVSASNTLASWAQVLNFKIPGVTVTESNGTLTITSNRGRSSKASVQIKGGTLTTQNMFVLGASVGDDKDYSLNRNLGQIRLEDSQMLVAGDRLTAGSLNTRAFIESAALGTINLITNAELWFFVDGDAEIIKTGIQAGTTVTFAVNSTEAWGKRVRASTVAPSFTNVNVGDWLIVNDPALVTDYGVFRVVDKSSTFVEIEQKLTYTASGASSLVKGGFVIVRASSYPQKIVIPAGTNYTALTLTQQLNNQLVGATAFVYKTVKIRVSTDNFDINGDIALVAQNSEAEKLQLATSSAVINLTSHLASRISGNPQAGTPSFVNRTVVASTGPTNATLSTAFSSGNLLVASRAEPDTGNKLRLSSDDFITPITVFTGGTVATLRKGPIFSWLPTDYVYDAAPYALNANDKMVAVVDGDVLTKRYSINMYRKAKALSAVYGATNNLADADNGNQSLAVGFGTGFDWKDFAVWMKARVQSHLSLGSVTSKSILWRYYRHGPDGNTARLQYRYSSTPNAALSVSTDITSTSFYTGIKVNLPTGPARTGVILRNTTWIGVTALSVAANLYEYTYVLGFDIASASRTANVTTLTLTLPYTVANHGLGIGNQIYVNSTNGSFTSGAKIITAITPSTISYAETAANAGPVASIGTINRDPLGSVGFGPNVVAGDIVSFQAGTIATPFANNPTKIAAVNVNGLDLQSYSDQIASISTTLTWLPITDVSKVAFFPVNTGITTAATIATTINTLTNCPVTAKDVGGGAGVITHATYELAPNGEGAVNPWYYLVDGINYVQTHNTPASPSIHFNFTFKDATTPALTTDSDWTNEDVRLVPVTAKNVVDFLNSIATSGLSSVAEVVVADDGQRPQISSLTPGSKGSVQIQGGSANSVASSAKTSAIALSGGYSYLSFPTIDLDGVSAGQWVELQNSTGVPKLGIITNSTSLTSIDTNGNFHLNVATWDYATTILGIVGGSSGQDWQFIKQGQYIQIRGIGGGTPLSGVKEGDYAIIKTVTGSTANDGMFRVIRNHNDIACWIENQNAVEEIGTKLIVFLKMNSILPGDIFSINTSLWGAGNVGNFTVQTIDLPSSSPVLAPFNGSGNPAKFKVQGVTQAVTGPIVLGASSPSVRIIEGAPSKLIKKIYGISPNPTDNLATDIKFLSDSGVERVGAFAGTILKPLNKLAFGVDIASGIDGYSRNTGLIAEANKVLYGVESDSTTYPGVVAAGAKVNISGPLIKRIEISLAIRVKTGISTEDIFDRVKSEVAAVVNNADIGSPIAISDIVKAAQNVNGVVAVSILAPTYNVTNDLISVQPFEKPLILNVDTDVLVSLVGE